MARSSRHAEDVHTHGSSWCIKRYTSTRIHSLSTPNNIIHAMARFITRVELHQADYDDYETLHSAMLAEGFEQTITSGGDVTYHLPTAEYYRETAVTRHEVLASARRAAAKTQRKFAVVVTQSNGITWSGLDKVN